jgi:predicted dehydrogenase
MRVGVVGCGYWGSKHVRVLEGLDEVSQTVVIDPRDYIRDTLQRSFSNVATFATLEAAVDQVDAVVIATPPSSHRELGLQALDAGLHVLIEKPLATSTADATALVERAEDVGRTLMVGHTFEHNAAVWKLRDIVRSGQLGDIYYIDTARLNLGLYQKDINVLWDLAPHDISIVNHLLGAEPTSVHAWGTSHAASGLEDVAYLKLDFPELSVVAHSHVSWLDPCKVRRATVVGSQKMAVYNDLSDDERIRVFDKGVDAPDDASSLHKKPMSYRYGGIVSPYIDFQEPLGVQDRHFVECVRTGRRPTTDGHNGRAVVQVLEAAQRSLRLGRTVAMEELAPVRV